MNEIQFIIFFICIVPFIVAGLVVAILTLYHFGFKLKRLSPYYKKYEERIASGETQRLSIGFIIKADLIFIGGFPIVAVKIYQWVLDIVTLSNFMIFIFGLFILLQLYGYFMIGKAIAIFIQKNS